MNDFAVPSSFLFQIWIQKSFIFIRHSTSAELKVLNHSHIGLQVSITRIVPNSLWREEIQLLYKFYILGKPVLSWSICMDTPCQKDAVKS